MCILRLSRISKLAKNQKNAVFGLKLMVCGSEYKVVLDESGFRVYCDGWDWGWDWGWDFLSVIVTNSYEIRITNYESFYLSLLRTINLR